ncbi:MAG: hypothetical protein KAH08_02475 [Methylococcales bacterium]|nr:hypothetical protein [Methylococcales bacterium]
MKHFKFFLMGLILSANIYADNTAVVLGYQSSVNDAIWQQKQLGFGVKNILQQALMDKTALSFIDEKVVLGFNNKNLDHELQQHWMLQEHQLSPDSLQNLATKHQLTYIFWIKIIDFKTEVSKISIAFFSSSKHEDSLELEVCRYTLASNSIECHAGEGTQSRNLNSILYKPMDNVNFNTSGAGQLSQEAIFEALPKVIGDEK